MDKNNMSQFGPHILCTRSVLLVLATSLTVMLLFWGKSEASELRKAGIVGPVGELVRVWRKDKMILLGEVHGTNETPALLPSMIREVGPGKTFLVGLELPQKEQVRVQRFLVSDGTPNDLVELLAGAFWKREGQDGRSSKAMAALLESLRILRSGGYNLEVTCFVPDGRLTGVDYEKGMAHHIEKSYEKMRPDFAVILSGNVHSGVSVQTDEAGNEPMGWHLSGLHPKSIAVTAKSGEFWACTGPQACGNLKVLGTLAGNVNSLQLFNTPSKRGYHGVLTLPRFTASAPAVSP